MSNEIFQRGTNWCKPFFASNVINDLLSGQYSFLGFVRINSKYDLTEHFYFWTTKYIIDWLFVSHAEAEQQQQKNIKYNKLITRMNEAHNSI